MSREPRGKGVIVDPGLKLRMRGEEKRISSQHKQLEVLFDRVLDSVHNGGARKATGDFLFFTTALEAHLSVEEDIYFPALDGLRKEVRGELEALMEDHQRFRRTIDAVREKLASNDRQESLRALAEFAADVDQHEKVEEDLLARITEGPTSFSA